MKIKVTPYSSQTSLLSSILFFILGAILFTNADAVLAIVSIGIGIILAIVAIVQIIIYSLQVKREESGRKSLVFGATLCLFFAIIFIFFHNIVEQFVRFIIGAWILFSGIMRFINCLSINASNKKFLPLLIISILLMATGIYTIITDHIFLRTIGVVMMIYAVMEIIGYIFYTKDTLEPIEPGTTTLIVKDNVEETETAKEEMAIVESKPRKVKTVKEETKKEKKSKKEKESKEEKKSKKKKTSKKDENK